MSLVNLPKIRITHHFRRYFLKDCKCQTDIFHNFRSKCIIKFFRHIHRYYELHGNHQYDWFFYQIPKLESLEFKGGNGIGTRKFGLRFKVGNAHEMELKTILNFKIKFR